MKNFKLDKEPKIGTGFKIPDDYFDSVAEKILKQVSEEEVPVIEMQDRKKSWVFAAAAVLVLALSIPVLNNIKPAYQVTDEQAIENYLSSHTEITDDQLVDLLQAEDIEKIKIDYNLEDKAVEDALSGTVNLEQYITD